MTSFKSKLTVFFISILSLGLIACTEEGNDRRFISEQNGSADPVMLQAKGAASATFYVKRISAANPQVLEYNELGFPRVKEYDISVCLADKATLGGLYGRPFIVSDGMTEQTFTSDDGGCLRWKETYSFDFFAPEKFIKFTRTIKGTNGIRGAVELEIAVNPWTNDFYDLRYNPVATVPNSFTNTPFHGQLKPAMAIGPDDAARIKQDSISLSYVGHDPENYEIDVNLNLTLAYKYFLEFNPTIFRRAISPQYKAEAATDGKVRLAVIFLRENHVNPDLSDFSNYIQHFEGVFDIEMGRIREPFTLKVSKLDNVDVRFRVLVAVEPIVSSSNVRPAYFEGYVGPLPTKSSLQLVPSEKYNVDQVLAAFKNRLEQIEPISPFERLQANHSHHVYRLDDVIQSARSLPGAEGIDAEFYEPLQTSTSPDEMGGYGLSILGREICRRFFGDVPVTCMNPALYLSARYVQFVEKVKSKPVKVGITIPEGIKFNLSSTSSANEAGNFNWGANLGLGLNFRLPIGGEKSPLAVSLGGSIGYGFSRSINWAKSRGYAVFTDQTFLVDKLTFKFTADLRECIRFELLKQYQDTTAEEKTPILVCRDEINEREVTESYYYIRKAPAGNEITTDNQSGSENPVRMVIRGEAQYRQFLSAMKRRGHTLFMFVPESWSDGGESLLLFQGMSQEFPGLLSE